MFAAEATPLPFSPRGLDSIDWDAVRVVALDAVGTLIDPEPSVADVYLAIGRDFGSRRTREEIVSRFAKTLRRAIPPAGEAAAEDFEQSFSTDEDREARFWREVVTSILDDAADPEACFARLFEHFARPEAWRLRVGAEAVLAECRRRGWLVAVASNFDSRLDRVMDGHRSLAGIERRVISSQVGFRKPAIGFYRKLGEITGSVPEHILMVGDDFHNDIEPAERLGMQAVLIGEVGAAEIAERGLPQPVTASLVELARFLDADRD